MSGNEATKRASIWIDETRADWAVAELQMTPYHAALPPDVQVAMLAVTMALAAAASIVHSHTGVPVL